MHVIQFLSHYFFVLNFLRMTSFLPDLVSSVLFVMCFLVFQLTKKSLFVSFFKEFNNPSSREGLKISDL